MKKYELLNQLQNEMKEARATVEQLCSEWNWTLSDKEAATIVNQIVINKGKVVEIQTTKEVVVDNTDTATIEMLRETIRQMNETINDMNKELTAKELLLNDFRETTDRLIKERNELSDKVEEQDLEIIALEEQNAFLTGKITGLQNELKEEKANVKTVYVEVENEVFEEEPEEVVVPVTKPVTKKEEKVYDLRYESINKTHDAIKAKVVTEHGLVFYCVWDNKHDKPSYSKIDNYKSYTRKGLGEIYKYDKQVMKDLKELRDDLLKELADKKKKNTRKPAPQVTKEVVEETPEEIVVNVTEEIHEEQVEEDPLAGADEMDFW